MRQIAWGLAGGLIALCYISVTWLLLINFVGGFIAFFGIIGLNPWFVPLFYLGANFSLLPHTACSGFDTGLVPDCLRPIVTIVLVYQFGFGVLIGYLLSSRKLQKP